MADIAMNSQYLLDLRKRLREMGSACQALNNFFVNGADRLVREADVKRLQGFATWLKHQLEKAKLSEDGAQYAWRKASLIGDIGELVGKAIGSTPGEHPRVEVFKKTLAARQTGKQHSFGTIMICVGQGGLPDDVHVVSISELARIKNRVESEIIREFQQRGEWLFSPEGFLVMLGTLIEKLHEGKLRLPISLKQLPAKLAIPREITVEYLVQIQLVPQLPPGRGASAKGKS